MHLIHFVIIFIFMLFVLHTLNCILNIIATKHKNKCKLGAETLAETQLGHIF